jgi:hypothetical protein
MGLLAVLAIWHAEAVAQAAGANDRHAVEDHPKSQQAAPVQPHAPPAQEQQSHAWDAERPCEDYTDPGQADLCQQWRMAKAAEQTKDLAYWQNLIVGGEAFLLFLTLIATAIAAVAAALAARAANKSVAVADKTAERQLRAYFLYDIGYILDCTPNRRPSVQLTFRTTVKHPRLK